MIVPIVNSCIVAHFSDRETSAFPLPISMLNPGLAFTDEHQRVSLVNSSDVEDPFNKGLALHSLREYQEAIAMYDKVLALPTKIIIQQPSCHYGT